MKKCMVESCLEEAYGRSGRCKPHKSEYNKAWYEKNKDKHKADARRNAEKYKEQFVALVNEHKAKGCTDCKEIYPPYVMDFDHLDETDKVANIAAMPGWSMEKIKAEIAKCEVVCANCHRIRTYKRRQKERIL